MTSAADGRSPVFHGKYRGKVAMNVDPLGLGRIVPLVPAISELPLGWALPSVPYAGKGVGMFTVPPIGTNVWVEFEGGDPNYPIFAGCFWGKGEVPASPAVPTTKMLKTEKATLEIDDLAGSLELTVDSPGSAVTVTTDEAGLKVKRGEVEITVADDVTITIPSVEVKVSDSKVHLKAEATELVLDSSAATLKTSSASLKVDASKVELDAGANAQVAVGPGKVDINGGALEVM